MFTKSHGHDSSYMYMYTGHIANLNYFFHHKGFDCHLKHTWPVQEDLCREILKQNISEKLARLGNQG